MSYIKSHYKKILEAKNKGDSRACAICKAVYGGVEQDTIDSMVKAFIEPFPQEVQEVMPNDNISEFGAGNPTAQPQALASGKGQEMEQNNDWFKPHGEVFHGDESENEDTELEPEEENIGYDISTIEKIQSLLKDKNLSVNDINRLLEGMKNGK